MGLTNSTNTLANVWITNMACIHLSGGNKPENQHILLLTKTLSLSLILTAINLDKLNKRNGGIEALDPNILQQRRQQHPLIIIINIVIIVCGINPDRQNHKK